tara:strand:- start:606 stop:1316 length:711 start_codon:yes stop_codon:yes gene_type:complete
MAEFFLSRALDDELCTEADLDALFGDFNNRVTADFDREQFKSRALRYRHFREPLRLFAEDQLVGRTAIFPGTLDKGGVNWNWTNVKVAHVQSVGTAPNFGDSGHAVVHVHGSYTSHEWTKSAYEIGIGYSTNGGVSYTHWQRANSFLGATRAHLNPMWSAQTTHYHSGAVTSYWPGSMYGKRTAHIMIGAMDFYGLDLTTVTHWALGIRAGQYVAASREVHDLDVANIRLYARDIS